MKIHKREPIIKERMETWKAKGKPSQQSKKKTKPGFLGTVARGAGIIGGKIAVGVKKHATRENAQKLGDWAQNTGDFMRSRSFDMDYGSAPKKPEKHKNRG